MEQEKYGRVLGEVYVSPDYVGEHINECIGDSDNSIDLSHDGWVSVNDILIEEGHGFTIMMVVRKRNFKKMKLKNKKKQRITKEIYKIVVPYVLETTTQSYKHITWSK